MSKNTPQDLLDEGFSPEQFGKTPALWSGLAQPLLDEANLTVQERAGDQYSNVSASIQNHIKRAERFFAVADLWDRRAARVDSDASSSQDNVPAESRRFVRNAEQATQKANNELAQIPSLASVSSAPAFDAASSTHFRPAGNSRNQLAGIGGVL